MSHDKKMSLINIYNRPKNSLISFPILITFKKSF